MSETKLTHVKTLRDTNFIGSHVLALADGKFKDLTVKISDVKREQVQRGDDVIEKTVVHLEGEKPMILNSTNEKSLINLFKTPFIENWIGKSFTLYVKQVRAFGDVHDALRIKVTLPKVELPFFDQTHAKWSDMVATIRSGNTTVAKLKETRRLKPEDEAILLQAEADSKLV